MTTEVLERTGTVTITVLDKPEDSRVVDRSDALQVAAARAQFADLIHRGYFCYREDGAGGGTVIREFEPDSDVTYVPRMVGG